MNVLGLAVVGAVLYREFAPDDLRERLQAATRLVRGEGVMYGMSIDGHVSVDQGPKAVTISHCTFGGYGSHRSEPKIGFQTDGLPLGPVSTWPVRPPRGDDVWLGRPE